MLFKRTRNREGMGARASILRSGRALFPFLQNDPEMTARADFEPAAKKLYLAERITLLDLEHLDGAKILRIILR